MEKKDVTRKILMMAALGVVVNSSACGEKGLSIEEQLRRQAQVAVKERLKDPESAQFRNVRLTKPNPQTDPEIGVERQACGEVNAKNSMGGYVGHKPFLVYTRVKNGQIIIDGAYIGEEATSLNFNNRCLNNENG